QALCGPQCDFPGEASIPRLLDGQGLPHTAESYPHGSAPFVLFHVRQDDVLVRVFDPPVFYRYHPPTLPQPRPTRDEESVFLALLDRLLEQFRPDVVVTYGGNQLTQGLIATVKARNIPVVFALHNFDYHGAGLFGGVDAVLVPSRFAQDHYRDALGLTCTALPSPLNWERLYCPAVEGRYVTFVNPQPDKGVFLFARIAHELGRRRPDIPLLVVEGRGNVNWLSHTGLDFRGLSNLHRMVDTADPRAFYQVSRLVL